MYLSQTLLRLFCLGLSSFLLMPVSAAAGHVTPGYLSDTCKLKRNRTFTLHFKPDTSTADFYNLLTFIESKKEFSRFGSDHKEDSSTASNIVLKKILCWEKLYQSPVERWKLQDVFSITYYLQSTPSGNKEQQSFSLTQLNFTDNEQMEVAAKKITEIRWGEPLLAFNFWFLIRGNHRIYIVQTSVPGNIAVAEKYRDIIKDEWVTGAVKRL